MRWLGITLLAFAIVLSGCSGKSGTSSSGAVADTSTSHAGTVGTGGGGGPTGGSSSGPGGGASGTGTIVASLNRTGVDGPAPLAVNFTLSATFKDSSGKTQHPESPSVTVTWTQTVNANGTAVKDSAHAGPTINSLPAKFSLTFQTAGKYVVTATVKANGYKDGTATVTILPRAPGSPTGPIFVDGGEGDTSQWTISSKVLVVDTFVGVLPTEETPVDNPNGKWQISDKEAHTGTHSWFSDYPDNYRGRIVSNAIHVPASGATLDFWVKGGAESNGVDGLSVFINGNAVVSADEGVYADWHHMHFAMPAGDDTLEFRMDADSSCSNATGPPGLCGTGYDAGGFYVDDITVQ